MFVFRLSICLPRSPFPLYHLFVNVKNYVLRSLVHVGLGLAKRTKRSMVLTVLRVFGTPKIRNVATILFFILTAVFISTANYTQNARHEQAQ